MYRFDPQAPGEAVPCYGQRRARRLVTWSGGFIAAVAAAGLLGAFPGEDDALLALSGATAGALLASLAVLMPRRSSCAVRRAAFATLAKVGGLGVLALVARAAAMTALQR